MSDLKTGSDLVPAARKEGDAVIARLRGEIDLHNSPELLSELLVLINRHNPKRLVLNLEQVPYMDSSALAVLVESLKRLRKTGGRVFLTDLQPRVWSLLELVNLTSIFVVTADEREALAKE